MVKKLDAIEIYEIAESGNTCCKWVKILVDIVEI